MNRRTGFVCHELYMWFNSGTGVLSTQAGTTIQPGEIAETAETKRRIRNLLEVAGMNDHLVDLRPRYATEDELARVHDRDYIARVKALSKGFGGDSGEGAFLGRGGFEIAQLSAGGTMALIDAVVTGQVDNGYALVRPPGHHAERDRGRGFCIFGNIPVAIHHARAVHGLRRVAVVDWDVHHGNGTQWLFWEDPDVLTISLHQERWYPQESGTHDEIGEGAGKGCNVNVPLPPGSGAAAYMGAMERVVAPALRRFRPELIVIASGFDGCIFDPLGRMMITSTTYRAMTRLMLELADELTGGRLMMSHEGGYSAGYVPYCGLAVMEELSGHMSGLDDAFAAYGDNAGGHQLYPHQDEAIARAAAIAGNVPKG